MDATKAIIRSAIERSATENKTTIARVPGDSGDALEAIREICRKFQWKMHDTEGRNRLHASSDDWSIDIHFSEGERP